MQALPLLHTVVEWRHLQFSILPKGIGGFVCGAATFEVAHSVVWHLNLPKLLPDLLGYWCDTGVRSNIRNTCDELFFFCLSKRILDRG
ncbi:hypothetical protein PVAP13_9NG575114 [Panicum virgatum]|nr:hypothetical protein PVAP13_9NG575114 [Panicum virgatum]KAG2540589.1 hypothetical protein PVAP13_9NG575114 [Panicum virgatum]